MSEDFECEHGTNLKYVCGCWDREERIKELESAMQEFVDDYDGLMGYLGNIDSVTAWKEVEHKLFELYAKCKQLLNKG